MLHGVVRIPYWGPLVREHRIYFGLLQSDYDLDLAYAQILPSFCTFLSIAVDSCRLKSEIVKAPALNSLN